jgi:ribosomal protein S18 acetylase RimI-like enzyme
VFRIVAFTVFALLLARVMRAPPGTWRYIVGAAVLVAAGSQLLPAGNAFREDVAANATPLLWVGLALVPVALYALVIRRLRRRTGADAEEAPARPVGLVLIEDDAALARDTARALAEEEARPAPETLSVGWRDEGGDLAGHARLRVAGAVADLEMLWVAAGARRAGIGSRLLAQAEEEARERGGRHLVATAGSEAAVAFLTGRGFGVYGRFAPPGGGERVHLAKALA